MERQSGDVNLFKSTSLLSNTSGNIMTKWTNSDASETKTIFCINSTLEHHHSPGISLPNGSIHKLFFADHEQSVASSCPQAQSPVQMQSIQNQPALSGTVWGWPNSSQPAAESVCYSVTPQSVSQSVSLPLPSLCQLISLISTETLLFRVLYSVLNTLPQFSQG